MNNIKFEIKYKEEELPREQNDSFGIFGFSRRINMTDSSADLLNYNTTNKKLFSLFEKDYHIEYLKVYFDNVLVDTINGDQIDIVNYEISFGKTLNSETLERISLLLKNNSININFLSNGVNT